MQTGTKISAAAHLGLIIAVLVGDPFNAEPLPFEVANVSVITAEQYAALTQAPEVAEPAAVSPPPVAVPDPVAPPPEPEAVNEPDPPAPPPEPEPDVAVETPPPDAATPPETERVAPDIVAPPPPEVAPDDVATPDVVEDDTADVVREPETATAPEAATDRIRPEEPAPQEEVTTFAPAASIRPPSRRPDAPVQTAAAPAPAPDPEPTEEPQQQDAINSALAEALGAAETAAPTPAGPPLSAGEKEALRVAVSQCWNVGSLSSAALATTVVVTVAMSADGRPQSGSIEMLSYSGGDANSARQAYEAARRAIIRCGARGFDLPAEKYAQWRDIEMTFNPERMRIR